MSKFTDFLMDMEKDMEMKMHEEWINQKKKAELQKYLKKLSVELQKENKVEDK